ncbi:FMR1-interacting protein NUFIP1 [Anopheles marshallii]|uniref:FMR1-interacting protein NUFIP1 n=1 Tax=Anopheles marshallii TaxID=1521116 RepID=UPI00237AD6E4|nr:FMR1-interacting protein NUFIP1 [Anopheles marshallii]
MAEEKFLLPPPKFQDEVKKSLGSFSRHLNPHFSTPNGMLLTRDKQPPPMYGPRGSTVPPRFLYNPRKRPAEPHAPDHVHNRQGQPGAFQNNYRAKFKHNNGGGGHNRSVRPPNNGLDKEVKPELLVLDWKLWCEGCDVNCRSEAEYQQHITNHAPCSVPGCKFVGHPMIMKRHERQTHRDERNASDPTVGPSSEEIEQWKEERRKRYPTKQNVILRQHAQEARFNRGERIEENKERFPNRHSSTKGESNENGQRKEIAPNGRNHKRSRGRKRSAFPVAVTAVEKTTGRIFFKGTSSLKDYKDSSKNALAMLGDYGSGSENDSDVEEQMEDNIDPVKTVNESLVQPESVLSDGEIVDDEVMKGDKNHCPDQFERAPAEIEEKSILKSICTEDVPKKATNVINVSTPQTAKNNVPGGSAQNVLCRPVPKGAKQASKSEHNLKGKNVGKPNRPLLNYSKLRRSNQNTMLEKLLDTDIRHERNVLLQCVRHVLLNKFFGIGQTNEEDVAAVSDEVKE